jgi:tellurite methyltransferase
VGADLYWDELWRDRAEPAGWTRPASWVVDVLPSLHDRQVRTTLDIGCGVGRHTTLLARAGFASHGIDKGVAGVARTREAAEAQEVKVAVTAGDITSLPYRRASFDYVLAFNVVYHADEDGLRQAVAEVRRVLRPGGLYQTTMLSKRNREYGRGIELSPNTFCQPDAVDDKVHPHLYTDASDLLRLHEGFELLSAVDAEQSTAGSFHWHCQFQLT